ncbi:hypothetical protein E2C01_010727 [Portunus trituberculatus]|uniref:Uncharacterized protein n=1 Tax=Portunus trituberculatus TaxID=210409 RepID=A0A5B7D966_PORTR|nr:hypothetical protein [Portunus trituberculatus]
MPHTRSGRGNEVTTGRLVVQCSARLERLLCFGVTRNQNHFLGLFKINNVCGLRRARGQANLYVQVRCFV